jgi:hypothetical protein
MPLKTCRPARTRPKAERASWVLLSLGGLLQLLLDVRLQPGDPAPRSILVCMTHTGTSRLVDGPIYHLIGVPYRTGSLTPGSEHDAQPYRDSGFVAQLQVAGCKAIDGGDIPLPSHLPIMKFRRSVIGRDRASLGRS